MNRGVKIAVPVVIAGVIIGLFRWLISGKEIDVLAPAGVIAEQQRAILMFALLLSAIVVIPVFTLLIYISITYRKGNKKATYDPEWKENKTLEGLWWGIPIAIIGVLGIITFQTTHSLDPYKTIKGDKPITVQVVALQWKWLFIYPEYEVATLNHLAIPVNQPVKLELTAESPMSALWIPAIGSQIYAMNGMQSELNLKATKIGEYKGYNTNINGEGYAKMIFTTKVMSEDNFSSWVERTERSGNELDMATYTKLAEASAMREERGYLLVDDLIFDKVMKQNMSHGSMPHSDNDNSESEE